MRKLLWEPSEERKRNANITKFMGLVNRRYGKGFRSYRELYDWSIENIPDFWASLWDFAEIKASKSYDTVVDDVREMPGVKWFIGARMNFAENLLRYRDDHTAFIFKGETQITAKMSYRELYDTVARLAKSLRDMGVAPGDRVAAYMPNMIETAVAMLAATSIGAVWSSCATDIGPEAAKDRFGQIEPKVLFTVDGYYYKGKSFKTLPNAAEVARAIPSLEKVVVASYTGEKADISHISNAVHYDDFLSKESGLEIQFEQLPSDHPVYIMFSSGTTGKPKCMVQGGTGVLINHFAEVVLHADLKREDTIMYITTCSWMMWNWLLSSLVMGATIVLYDGNPGFPDPGAMWRLIQDEKITIFGTSATYLNYIRSQGLTPGKDYDLSALREINQTGSIQIHSDTGGITIFGRSDSTLNPSGVRIGTAEIYNQVEKLEELADSLAIGQSWQGDQRIVLFVKLSEGCHLTEDLKNKVKKTLRENASPRHVPAKIIQVSDIPYTLNMKKVESAVTNIIHGKPVLNRDALVNPESLDYYEDLEELQS